jgi:hypothetical protein
MVTHTLEGIWEDVAKNAKTLKGKRVKVTVYDDDDGPGPNKEALRVIREVEKKQKNMRETSGEDTQKILREGRNGKIYGK